jgi:hypothetical protein
MSKNNKERNERIVALWNTTKMAMSQIADQMRQEGFNIPSRNTVGGVIHRVKRYAPEKITRKHDNKPGSWRKLRYNGGGIPGAVASMKRLVDSGKQPPSVNPALCQAMGAAVRDRLPNQCCYPLDVPEPQFLYCAEVRWHDETCYCETHHRLMHRGFAQKGVSAKWSNGERARFHVKRAKGGYYG